jgi:hypothetical protein
MPASMYKKKGKKAGKTGLKAKAKALKKPKSKGKVSPGPWAGIGGMG